MNQSSRRLPPGSLLLGVGALLFVGCSDDDRNHGPAVEPPIGTMELRWTLAGEQSAGACERFGVDALDATVLDEGYVVERIRVPCDELSTSLDLYIDDYLVRMTLVDSRGYRITDRIFSVRFVLRDGETELIEVDFPESSFIGFIPAPGGGAGAGGAGAEGSAGYGGAGLAEEGAAGGTTGGAAASSARDMRARPAD